MGVADYPHEDQNLTLSLLAITYLEMHDCSGKEIKAQISPSHAPIYETYILMEDATELLLLIKVAIYACIAFNFMLITASCQIWKLIKI